MIKKKGDKPFYEAIGKVYKVDPSTLEV
jgi:hypothetical protein